MAWDWLIWFRTGMARRRWLYRAKLRVDRDSQSSQPGRSIELSTSGHSSAIRKFIELVRSVGRVSQCKHIRYKIKLDNLQSQSGQLGIEMGTHRGQLGKNKSGSMSITYGPMWKSLGPKCVSVCRGSVFFLCNGFYVQSFFNIRSFQAIIWSDCSLQLMLIWLLHAIDCCAHDLLMQYRFAQPNCLGNRFVSRLFFVKVEVIADDFCCNRFFS